MISVKNLKVSTACDVILENISFTIKEYETLALIGPSGAGKSSLIKSLCGIWPYKEGSIYYKQSRVKDLSSIASLVPQENTLLPWKTLLENVSLPNTLHKRKKADIINKSHVILDKLNLNSFHNHFPDQLSGGMLQRAYIARALTLEHPLLILDEPCSSIDVYLKEEILSALKKIKHELKITLIIVTHDFRLALEIADRIALIHNKSISHIWDNDPEDSSLIEKRHQILKDALYKCYHGD